jgi:hypothetical protein
VTASVALDEAWDRAVRGIFEPGALDAYLGDDEVAARAWELVLASLSAHQGDAIGPSPEAFAMARGGSELARSAAVLGLAMRGREALLRFDREALDRVLAQMAALDPETTSARAASWCETTHLHAGGDASTASRIESLATRASAARLADVVIEAGALRVSKVLEDGDTAQALALARRLSHRARAEGIRAEEYLASLSLARARRYAGRPHLATRIAQAVAEVAPKVWRPWIDWELRLAGEAEGIDAEAHGAAIARVVQGFVAGDDAAIARARAALEGVTRGLATQRRSVDALLSALDPRDRAMPHELAPWAHGETDRMPLGLDAVVTGFASPHAKLAGNAWVWAAPDGSARRFLHPGLGALGSVARLEGTARLHGRTELATAVLALRGPAGLSVDAFVRKVYGFPYARDAHDGMLRVLLHRMRGALEGVGRVTMDDSGIALRAERAFVVPDPRTAAPNEDRVLRMLAARRGTSAKEIATALGMPLRTVQAVLGQLVDEGACLAARSGPAVEYTIEDTTFSDPTTTASQAGR